MNTTPTRPYAGRVIAIGTMHGKEAQLRAPFHRWHDATIQPTTHLDTDALGTFTGETPRTLSPIDAATAKARAALVESATGLAIATEASYATSAAGFGPVIHEEIAVFLDQHRDIQVIERIRTVVPVSRPREISTLEEAASYLSRAGFPQQGVVVRDEGGLVMKGVTRWEDVSTALTRARITLEPDLRAHHNPARRRTLRRIGWQLAARLCTPCPHCGTPGFGKTRTVPGLPCAACAAPTRSARADLLTCANCAHTIQLPRPAPVADPATCDSCNP